MVADARRRLVGDVLRAHAHHLIERIAGKQRKAAPVVLPNAAPGEVNKARPVRAYRVRADRSVRAVGLRDGEAAGVCAPDFKHRAWLDRQQIAAERQHGDERFAVPRRLHDHAPAQRGRLAVARPVEGVIGPGIEDRVRVRPVARSPYPLSVAAQHGELYTGIVASNGQRLALHAQVAAVNGNHPVLRVGKDENVHRLPFLHGLIGHAAPRVALVSRRPLHPALGAHRVGIDGAVRRRDKQVRVIRPVAPVKARQCANRRPQRRERAGDAVAGGQKPPLCAHVHRAIGVVGRQVRVARRLIDALRGGDGEAPLVIAVAHAHRAYLASVTAYRPRYPVTLPMPCGRSMRIAA